MGSDGWRSRYLAPVYALVLSFLVVLVAGFGFARQPATGSEPGPGNPSVSTTVPTTAKPLRTTGRIGGP